MDLNLDFLSPGERARLADYRENFIRRGRAAVLIGAGVSLRAGLPNGPTLARALCGVAGIEDDPQDDLISVCDRIVAQHGAPYLHRQLASALDDEATPLSDAHQILARIDFSSYVTTNVDRLMEWALRDAAKRPGALFLSTDTELLRLNRVPVIKPHGDLGHPHTMIFSTADFAAFENRRPAFQRLLHSALEDSCLLIVGYRGDDPNFRAILDLIDRDGPGAEHLLVDFGRAAEREELLTRGLFLIDPGPGEYARLADILGYLAGFDAALLDTFTTRRHLFRANPFPGLSPYRYAAEHFHGREELSRSLFERLPELSPVTVFFGDSGCGKSSVFQAGLAPLLERAPDYRWAIRVLDDRQPPALQLEQAVAELSANSATPPQVVLVLDQFERLFTRPYTPAQQAHFLGAELPALVQRWRGRVRLCLVLRSDALHHLQPYRDRPGLGGIYYQAQRIATLTRSEAEQGIRRTFLRRNYRLSPPCARALATQASTEPERDDTVYLPYLQLLANRFYEWLEVRHARERGFGKELRVELKDFRRYHEAGDPIDALVAETLADLMTLEPETATVLNLLNMLTEGGQRRLLRRGDLARRFIDPDRLERLLATLADRRVLHFEEILGGYELVHDSLVEPIQRTLEQWRVDFSSSELLVIARNLYEGHPPSDALLRNLLRFSLTRGLGSEWLDTLYFPAGGWAALYLELLRESPRRDAAPFWEALARHAQKDGQAPAGLGETEILDAFLAAEQETCATAALHLLALRSLSKTALGILLARLDPDHRLADPDSYADPIQHRDWQQAFAIALDILLADPRIKPDSLFQGFHSVLASRREWWFLYYERLLTYPELPAARLRKRLTVGLNVAEDEDVEQLLGIADALLAQPSAAAPYIDLVNRCRMLLRRRRGKKGYELILPLCQAFVKVMPKQVFLELGLHLTDLARGGQRHHAARLLGLSAQNKEDWLELCGRYFVTSESEAKGALLQALMDSPAVLDELGELGELRGADDPWHTSLALFAAQMHRAGALAASLQWLSDATFPPAPIFAPDEALENFILRAYALADGLMHQAESDPQTAILALIRLFRLVCGELARRATIHLPDEDLALPEDALAERVDEFLAWWDDVLGVLPGLGGALLGAADHLQGQMRWLQHQLRRDPALPRGGLRLLVSRLEEWQARYHALAQVCQTPGYLVYMPRVSHSPVYAAIRLLLERDDLNEQWATLPEADGDSPGKCLRAMDDFARTEEAAALGKALSLAEVLILWVLRVVAARQVDGIGDFLWGLLGRSHRVPLPGYREEEIQELLVAALLREYAGGEDKLAASLGVAPLDMETHLRVLASIERQAPGSASEAVWAQLFAWAEEDPSSPLLAEVLAVLRDPPQDEDWCRRLEALVESTPAPAVRRAALDCLQRLTPGVGHRLLALRWALAGSRA